jgi:hypothetical protein
VTAAPDPTFRLILDAYSPLSHKQLIGDGRQVVTPTTLIHSWVPLHERRRLAAYLILDAYRKNSVRIFLGRASLLEQADHREYGDVQLILGRIAHGVLGDDFEITVEGADDDLGDAPDLPEAPVDPGPDATPIEQRIYAIQQSRYDDAAATAVDEWEQNLGNQPLLAARQDDLRDWADRIGLAALLVEGEADCVALGDTVYALWPQTGGWPEVRRYDPDAYFPILEDDLEGFPDKVHLAWEFEETTPDGVCERYLRRLTWELVPIDVIDPVTREVLGRERGRGRCRGPKKATNPPRRRACSPRACGRWGPSVARRTPRRPPRTSPTCPRRPPSGRSTRTASNSTAWTWGSTSCRSSTSRTPRRHAPISGSRRSRWSPRSSTTWVSPTPT